MKLYYYIISILHLHFKRIQRGSESRLRDREEENESDEDEDKEDEDDEEVDEDEEGGKGRSSRRGKEEERVFYLVARKRNKLCYYPYLLTCSG